MASARSFLLLAQYNDRDRSYVIRVHFASTPTSILNLPIS